MKLVLSDLSKDCLADCDISVENQIVFNNKKIRNCIGCFNCWTKTPGKCFILDGYEEMGKNLSLCNELIIVSECVYGSTSPFIKNVLDRSISYIHPNFCTRNGEMHHQRRYDNKIKITAYFYGGNITEAEKETARKLIKATVVNYDGEVGQITFFKSKEELRGISL